MSKPFIHLGNLSYSLYLWRFLIIVYKKFHITLTGTNINYLDFLAIGIISYIFALTWFYLIENLLRAIKVNTRYKQIYFIVISLFAMLVLAYVLKQPYHRLMDNFKKDYKQAWERQKPISYQYYNFNTQTYCHVFRGHSWRWANTRHFKFV